jgi:CRISPR type I-E-associated protein CasB/Cse2
MNEDEEDENERLDRFNRRFERFLLCDSSEEVCVMLGTILGLLKTNAIPINFEMLYTDLIYWSNPVKIRWGSGYWKGDK